MKNIVKLALFVSLLAMVRMGAAQTPPYLPVQNFCSTGGQVVKTSGMSSTTTVQASYPQCLINVFNTGTSVHATIYKDAIGTPLGNPFLGNKDASWIFYVPNVAGQGYDVTMTGGVPNAFPLPFTLVNLFPNNPGTGGGGGGAAPAGADNEINAKFDPSTFQGTGLFTNTAHTFLSVPSAQFANMQNNVGPNFYCGGRGCGQITNYNQNIPNNDGNGNLTGFAQAFYNYRNALYTGQGIFNGFLNSPNEASGGAVTKFLNDQIVFQSDSISQADSKTVYCSKPHDCATFYAYTFNHGGMRTGGDEGVTPLKMGGGNDFRNQGQGPITGNPAAGATTITLASLTNAFHFFVGGYVIDFTKGPSWTGNVTNYVSGTNVLTTRPGDVVQAAANGTTLQAINIPGIPTVNGVTLSINTHFDNGTDTQFRNGLIVFGCANAEIEFVNATVTSPDGSGNQVITGTFYHGHLAGCQVSQGGTMGVMDLIADRKSNWKTSYFVFAAPDNSHLNLRTYGGGTSGSAGSNLGIINAWKHNFGGLAGTAAATILSRASNVMTICGLGQSQYNFGGQFIRISGASDNSFNGLFTVSTLNANRCVTTPNVGPDVNAGTVTGQLVQTGGDVNGADGTPGTGAFAIWKTAYLVQMGTTSTTTNGITTQAYNNQLILRPNNIAFSNGDLLMVLDDMQNKTEMITAIGVLDTAPPAANIDWLQSRFVGEGVAGIGFHGMDIQNNNLTCLYKGGWVPGCGSTIGLLEGPVGLEMDGVFGWGIRMTAPLPNHPAIEIYQNQAILTGTGNNSFNVIQADGVSGNPGFGVNYNPGTGVSLIQSGLADGIQSVITITRSEIDFDATTQFVFNAPVFQLKNLTGTGSRCVQAGATGILSATTACSTLTSVGLAVPTWAGVTGSPVTTSGTLTLTLPAFKASGTLHAPGIVPDPGGIVGTTKFLREDGTWQLPTAGFSGTCAPTTTATVVNGLITGCS